LPVIENAKKVGELPPSFVCKTKDLTCAENAAAHRAKIFAPNPVYCWRFGMSWSRTFGEGLVVLAVAAGMVAVLSATTHEMAPQWDMVAYRYMAANGLIGNSGARFGGALTGGAAFAAGPWAFRPAAPLIIGAISRRTGLSIADTFRAGVRLMSVVLIALCFLFARRVGAKPGYALWIAVVLMGLNWSVKWAIFTVSMVDIYAYPIMLLAFWALWEGRLWLALAIAAPGLLFKEFLLVPLLTVAGLWTYDYWGNWRRIALLLAPVAACLIVFFLLPRALIHVQYDITPIRHRRTLLLLIRSHLDPRSWIALVLQYVWIWLPVFMLLDRARLAALRTRLAPNAPMLVMFSAFHFLLLAVGGPTTMLVVKDLGWNTLNYMSYSLPVAIVVMAYLLEDGRPHWLELVLITVCVALFTRDFSPFPLPEVDLDRYNRYFEPLSLLRFSELLACIAGAVLLRRLLLIFNTSRPNSNTRTLSALR
jgi:hypothetical protein